MTDNQQTEAHHVQSVHLFGFFEADDLSRPNLPSGAAPSSLTPWEHFERLRRHHAHFGDEVTDCKTTRTLDGLFVAAEWVSPPRAGDGHGATRPIWHMVTPPSEMWADFEDQVTP